MFKEMIPSMLRYLLAGFAAWMTSELSRRGFDAESAEGFTEAVLAVLSAGALLFWSGKKNKVNADIKKEVKEIKERTPLND